MTVRLIIDRGNALPDPNHNLIGIPGEDGGLTAATCGTTGGITARRAVPHRPPPEPRDQGRSAAVTGRVPAQRFRAGT